MNLRSTILIAAMLAVLSPLRSAAALYQDGYDDAAARQLATNYSASLANLSLSVGTTNFNASAVFLNSQWLLTSAHAIADASGTVNRTINGVIQGATSGGPLIPLGGVHIFPGYDSTGNTPDIALIRVGTNVTAPALLLGSASTDEVVTSAGFGTFGSVSGGLFLNNGDARGWQARVSNDTYGNYSSTYYQSSLFGPSQQLALNGRGIGGDSGSPVFNSSGYLVGINIASGGGFTPVGDTEFLRLTQPDVLNWIQNTITPVEPQIVRLTATNADVQLVWQGKGGSNYVVQASAALGGTNTFTDLSGVIALSGAGPVLTNYLDAGALTNHTSRFYRIRLQ